MKARKRKLSERLGQYVRQRYNAAVDGKREVYALLTKCVRLMEGDRFADADGVDVNINIIRPIVRGVKGMMKDVLADTNDQPYTVVSTPIPTLPRDVQDRLEREIENVLPQLEMMVPPEQIRPTLEKMRNMALLMMNKEAQKTARKMETQVKDDMVEGNWAKAFDQALYNFVQYPFAVMKSPSLIKRVVKEWDGNKLIARTKMVRACENISPFNFYWAPNATSVETAEYLLERRRIGADELIALADEDQYDAELIDHILDTLPDGHIEPYDNGSDIDPILVESGMEADVTEPTPIIGMYDAIGLYAKMRGADLIEFGIDVDDERNWYEAITWSINDIVFSVTLNPDPAGTRPFRVAAYDALPGQLYGTCPALELEDTWRVCSAAVRALVRNMAFASGPIGEVDPTRLADDDDPRILHANMIRLVRPNRGSSTDGAYRWHDVNSHAPELMGVFDKFLALAYELLGIPRVAFGATDGLGTIGRTQGGLALVMNQASKTIKDALRTVETDIIEPTVQSYIDWNLLYNPDMSIKGDIHAYARGVSGVLEREAQREKLTWALQSIVPLVSTGTVPQEAVLRIIYALFQANGLSTDGILPDFDSQEAAATDMAGLGLEGSGAGMMPSAQNVPQLPGNDIQLDGRSAVAANAIDNMNSVG